MTNGHVFDCENCKWGFHCTESPDPKWPKSRGPAPFPKFVIGKIEMTTCPKPKIGSDELWYFRMYQHYRRGFLPYSGPLNKQPAKYIHAMELIDANTASEI